MHITPTTVRFTLTKLVRRPHPDAPDLFGQQLLDAMSPRPRRTHGGTK